MSHLHENRLTFHMRYQSPLVTVRDYRCCIPQSGPAQEEQADSDDIVLLRQGTFRKHFGSRSVTADVNQAVFFARHSTYRVSHPAECGDRGTTFAPAPRILKDILRVLDPAVEERTGRLFPFVTGPCNAGLFWRHRAFVQRLENVETAQLEPLWADVTALQLIADTIEAAYLRHDISRSAPSRPATSTSHIELVEAVKTYLASHLHERVMLDEMARAVHSSPFHLARIFQQLTGSPIHRYLTQLRLRVALERLMESADDLTTIALELGFSSHSHFTDAFRNAFGCAPSTMRRQARNQTLREMSKILEV